jgi:hypothetical protein
VFVTGSDDMPLRAGALVDCEIVAYKNYDLIGVAMPSGLGSD